MTSLIEMRLPLWFILLVLPGFVCAQGNKPYLLDVTAIPSVSLEKEVRKALVAPIKSIIDKVVPSPSGNAHDYISYGRYYWPDPATPNGLPFIKKDGHPNRDMIDKGDGKLLGAFVDNVETLALGWSQLHNPEAARRAGNWLRVWMITPATRLNREFEYAQIRMGTNHNHGSASGLIDTRSLIRVIDATRLLHGSPGLTAIEEKAVKEWFTDYLHWLTTSPNGRAEHEAKNNHGSWYLTQAVAISRFIGRDEQAKLFAHEDFARINWQIDHDGRQPLETARVDGLSYSVFNLEAQLRIARLAYPLGVDLWNYTTPQKGSLKKALDYLKTFDAAPQKWPHNQLAKQDAGFLQPLVKMAARLDVATQTK